MKVKKLIVDYKYDFELYGIVTSLKDYKMAWSLNKQLNIPLVRTGDHVIESNNKNLEVINYVYQTEHSELRLFKNKTAIDETKTAIDETNTQQYMVPEMKHFDYFIMVSGIIHTFTAPELLHDIRSIEGLQLINEINIDTLKSRDYFLF